MADYRSALKVIRPKTEHWTPTVLLCSALTSAGVEEVWRTALEFKRKMKVEYMLCMMRIVIESLNRVPLASRESHW